MSTLYHWAPKAVRGDIAEHGLDASRSGLTSDPRSHAPVAVYFHHSREAADEMGSEGVSHTHDLYEVQSHGLRLHPDPYQSDASYTRQVVSPDRLKRVSALALPSTYEAFLASLRAQGAVSPSKQAKHSGNISVAGIALLARDTGRVLMIQRSHKDKNDPARGTWEFPGGHVEEGEEPLEGAKREFTEETGAQIPKSARLDGNWVSGGIYQGFLLSIGRESALDLNLDHEDRKVLNPDDPDGDDIEVCAWWDASHIRRNPAVRKEVRDGTDFGLLGVTQHKQAAQHLIYEVGDPDDEPPATHHITNYPDSARVHPSTFGMQIREDSPRDTAPREHFNPPRPENVPLHKVWGSQDYVYAPHVHNLASVPGDVMEPIEGRWHDDGSFEADDHHRVAAAHLRGDTHIRALVHSAPKRTTALLTQAGLDDDDYRMSHRPPNAENGTPIHDITHNFPADIYTHPHYYSDMSEPSNVEAHSVIRRVRGNPEAKVKIYRALPAEHAHQGFRPGDWVTTSKDYARQHGQHATDPKHDWPVISTTVPAKHLHTDGDDFREFGYNGDDVKQGSVAYKGGYHQEVSQKADGTVSQVQRKAPSPIKGFTVTHEHGSYDDMMAGRGGVSVHDREGNYAGHMRWDSDGIFTHNIEPQHADVAEHLDKKMRSFAPPQHRTAARRDPHHGEGPWYHGTNADFENGQELQPGDTVGKSHGKFSDGTKVWVSNDPVRAAAYGHRLYEVTPHSRPRSPYANHDEHHTSGATVVREVPYDEARRLSQARTAAVTEHDLDEFGGKSVSPWTEKHLRKFHAEDIHEEGTRTFPIGHVWGGQTTVDRDPDFQRSEDHERPPTGKMLPNGHVMLVDGHHRYADALQRGDTHFDVAVRRHGYGECRVSKGDDDSCDFAYDLKHSKTAASHVLDQWQPTERLFAPTKETLDPTLFDEQRVMRPSVREAIMGVVEACLKRHGWGDGLGWTRIYLAGSQASLWWGNHDFDLLLGVDFESARAVVPAFVGKSDQEVADLMNQVFWDDLDDEHWHPSFDPQTEWHLTCFVNVRGWDIRDLHPYAAYNVTEEDWTVEPVSEPEGHQFGATEYYYAEGVAAQIRSALALPEPQRTQRCSQIWSFIHTDRSRAFGPHGAGAFDRGNMLEKYLSQASYGDTTLMDALTAVRFGNPVHAASVMLPHEDMHGVRAGEAGRPVRGHQAAVSSLSEQDAGRESEGSAKQRRASTVPSVRRDEAHPGLQQQRVVRPLHDGVPPAEVRQRPGQAGGSVGVHASVSPGEDVRDHDRGVRGAAGGAGWTLRNLPSHQGSLGQGEPVRGPQPRHRGSQGAPVRPVQPLGQGPGGRSGVRGEGADLRAEARGVEMEEGHGAGARGRQGLDHAEGGRRGPASGRGQGSSGPAQPSADEGGAQAQPLTVTWHPKAVKDLKGLDRRDQDQILKTVDGLASQHPTTMAQTHPLKGVMKGWSSTKASRGHRIVHQSQGDGVLHIGYVGLHEYGDAQQRLSSLPATYAEFAAML